MEHRTWCDALTIFPIRHAARGLVLSRRLALPLPSSTLPRPALLAQQRPPFRPLSLPHAHGHARRSCPRPHPSTRLLLHAPTRSRPSRVPERSTSPGAAFCAWCRDDAKQAHRLVPAPSPVPTLIMRAPPQGPPLSPVSFTSGRRLLPAHARVLASAYPPVTCTGCKTRIFVSVAGR